MLCTLLLAFCLLFVFAVRFSVCSCHYFRLSLLFSACHLILHFLNCFYQFITLARACTLSFLVCFTILIVLADRFVVVVFLFLFLFVFLFVCVCLCFLSFFPLF